MGSARSGAPAPGLPGGLISSAPQSLSVRPAELGDKRKRSLGVEGTDRSWLLPGALAVFFFIRKLFEAHQIGKMCVGTECKLRKADSRFGGDSD